MVKPLESRAWPAPANQKLSNQMNTALKALQGAESLLLAAIRLAYRAGAIAGHFAWPVIHGLTAAAKWAWANVDWAEVGLIIRAGLIALVGLTWAGAVTGHRLLVLGSAALGRWYAALLLGGGGGANPAAPAAAAPVVAKTKPTKPRGRRRHGRAGGLAYARSDLFRELAPGSQGLASAINRSKSSSDSPCGSIAKV